MIKFLRKILYIQTLKLVLINPDVIDLEGASNGFKHLPVILIINRKVDDIKIIDTGIPVRKLDKADKDGSI